jgi:hypothetical protein
MIFMRRFRIVISFVAIVVAAGLVPVIVRAEYLGTSTHNGKQPGPLAAGSSPTAGGGGGTSRPGSTNKPVASPASTARGTPGTRGSSDGTSSPRSSPGPSANPAEPSASSSPVPTQEELAAALLTTADLPGGYSAEPPGSGLTLNSLTECPELGDGPNPDAQAAVAFTAGNQGPDVSETLLQYSVSAAKAQISLFTRVAQACNNLSFTAAGLTFSVGIVTEHPPGLGDESVALRINAALTAYNITINGDLVAVRHGGTVIVVTNVGLPLNAAVTQTVVSQGYAKVAARW